MNALLVIPAGTLESWVIDTVKQAVHVRFGMEIQLLDPTTIPEEAKNESRRQIEATQVMRGVLPELPAGKQRAVVLLDEDLFIPMLTFVFGLAQVGGRVALVSLARLRQEYYGLPANPDVVRTRLVKEVLHELGHTFGLVHCPDVRCVMSVANTVQHVDQKSSEFCGGCRSVLDDALRTT